MRIIHYMIASRTSSPLNCAFVMPERFLISRKPMKGDTPPTMKEQRKAKKKAEQGFA